MVAIATVVNSILSFVVFAFLLNLVVKERHPFLYIVSTPATLVYGLYLAATSDGGSFLWVAGLVFTVIGFFLLFKAVVWGIQTVKRRQEE